MMGQQTETFSDVQDSINLARKLDPNYVHFTIFCPYPATKAYLIGLEQGIIKRDIWQEFAANPREDFELPFWEENFTTDELRTLLVKAYKSFYLRPGYIIKNVARIRRPGEFKRKIKAGLSVFSMSSDKRKITTIAIKKKVHDIIPLASYMVSLPGASEQQPGNTDSGVYDVDYYQGRQKKSQLIYRLRRRTDEVEGALRRYNDGRLQVIVDIGTADGLMLQRLRQRLGPLAFLGFDLSLGLLKSHPIDGVLKSQSDALEMPVQDGAADAIIATAIIEHVPDPDAMLRECARMLRPGGLLIITTPDPLMEKISSRIGLLKEAGHNETLNLSQLCNRSEAAGFQVVEAKKFMFSPVGFPAERLIERGMRAVGLGLVMANQLVVVQKV
jgi:2-polyprenyl-3-methyl-5-hydroxy-6-metoxy-1,4-benzoquinol methylase